MKYIYFTGIDGAGKTTYINRLNKAYVENGFNTKTIWFRRARLLSIPWLLLGYILGYAETIYFPNNVRMGQYNFYKSKLFSMIWIMVSIGDYCITSIFKMHLSLMLAGLKDDSTIVLVDRYVIDFLIDLECDTRIDLLDNKYTQRFIKWATKNWNVILLDLDESIAFNRKKDIFSIAYLKCRRERYIKIGTQINAIKIDVNRSIDEVFKDISAKLEKHSSDQRAGLHDGA